jgi:hypothetical protein
MPVDVKIIVTDAPPLTTLAAAKSLDYLLYPALPVYYPGRGVFRGDQRCRQAWMRSWRRYAKPDATRRCAACGADAIPKSAGPCAPRSKERNGCGRPAMTNDSRLPKMRPVEHVE